MNCAVWLMRSERSAVKTCLHHPGKWNGEIPKLLSFHFQIPHRRTHRSTFGGGKCHHCSRSLLSCQNTKGWKGCRLWWHPARNAQSLESRSFLADSRIASNMVFWERTERLANWGDHPHTQEGRQERMLWLPRHLSLAFLEKCMPSAVNKGAAR